MIFKKIKTTFRLCKVQIVSSSAGMACRRESVIEENLIRRLGEKLNFPPKVRIPKLRSCVFTKNRIIRFHSFDIKVRVFEVQLELQKSLKFYSYFIQINSFCTSRILEQSHFHHKKFCNQRSGQKNYLNGRFG